MGKLVNVVKDFTLNLQRDGQIVALKFKAGLQELEADVLGHWFTKAHVEEVDAKADSKASEPEQPAPEAPATAVDDAKQPASDVAKSADTKAAKADSKA